MPTPAKQQAIDSIAEALGRSKSTIIADYRGLTVEEISRLRRRLRPVGAQFSVIKNTLFKIALENQKLPKVDEYLEGPNAVMLVDGDPAEATKVLAAFIKELRRDVPQIKGGLLGARVMNAADVANLATLPSREVILGNLVGTLQAPMSGVVSTLGAVMQNLIGTIEAYQAKTAESAS